MREKQNCFYVTKLLTMLIANEKVPKLGYNEKRVFVSEDLSEKGYFSVVSLAISKQIELET